MDCLKKKEKVEAKKIAPNNKLYILLLLVAVALTGFSLPFKENEAVFTIWTSISCGGIASIIVAWLIDVANCRQAFSKTLKNREALFANLYHGFDNGLQLLIFKSAEINHCTDSKKWYEWIDVAYEQAQQNPDMISLLCHSLMIFLDDVSEQVYAIKGQEAFLLDSGIICQEDIQALSTMQAICETSRTTYRSKDSDSEFFQQVNTNCGLLRGLIGYAPTLRPINDMEVEPRVYLMALKNGIKTPQKETILGDAQ